MTQLLLLLACSLQATICGMGSARAENLSNRIVIFDLSASMWAPVGGDHRRYEIAEITGEQLVRETAAQQPDVSLGLMAFGYQFAPAEHRCNEDVATLASPAPLASARTMQKLAHLAAHLPTPKGKTPLKEAVRQAARGLKDGGILIVVSDFEETCDGEIEVDPCEAFAELQRAGELDNVGIRFIVAIADQAQDIGRMSAFARCTGAKLVRVDSAEAAAQTAAAIAADLKRLSVPLDLRVRFKFDRDTDLPPPWGTPPLDGTIQVEGAAGGGSARIDGPIKQFSLTAGSYKITASVAGARWTADVLMRERGMIVDVEIPVAQLALSAIGPESEAVSDGTWTVTAAGGATVSRQGTSARFTLPPGRYHVRVRSRFGGSDFDLDLGPGGNVRRQIQLDAAFQPPPANSTISLSVRAEPPSSFAAGAAPPELLLTAGGKTLRVTTGGSAKLVGPGHYDAAVAWNGARWPVAPLDIAGGAATAISVDIAPSVVEAVFAGAPGGEILWTISGAKGETVRLRGARLSQSLPPGAYTIEGVANGETRRAHIELGFGQALRIELPP
jgi:hypothetical protein